MATKQQAIYRSLMQHGYVTGYAESYMRKVALEFLREHGVFRYVPRMFKDLDSNERGIVLVKDNQLPDGFMWVRHPQNRQKVIIKKGKLSESIKHLEICYDQNQAVSDRPTTT